MATNAVIAKNASASEEIVKVQSYHNKRKETPSSS